MSHSPLVLGRRSLLALGAAALTGPAHGARAQDNALRGVTLRVATFRGQDQTLLTALGLTDFPYAVEFKEFNSGNLIAQAMNADAIDLGPWSEIPMVFAAAARSSIAVVATLDGPTTDQAVLVAKDAPFRSIRDLRNKRVGYLKATTSHYFLIKMLHSEGMSFSDIHPVALGMSEGLTAMKSGSLDAWATYGYAIQMLESQGDARVLRSAADILSGHYFIGANPRRLGDDAFRRAAADYIGRIARAYAILTPDKPRWARIIAPAIQVPEPVVLAALAEQNRPYHPRAWRQADIDSAHDVAATFAGAGILPPSVDLQSVFSTALSSLLQS